MRTLSPNPGVTSSIPPSTNTQLLAVEMATACTKYKLSERNTPNAALLIGQLQRVVIRRRPQSLYRNVCGL
jgi:hypothetical protein